MTIAATRWVMTAPGVPMVREAFAAGPLAAGEVAIEVAGCGVCHTDLGYFYDGVRTNHALPLALGHEVAGRVAAAGEGAEAWVGKPVLVHDREAHAEVTEALVAWAAVQSRVVPGILHCFSGDLSMAMALVAAGFRISFALPVSFSSNHGPRDAATAIPEAALLVETDSPYLGGAPERRNEPTTTLRVAAELARLRGVEPESIATVVRAAYGSSLA